MEMGMKETAGWENHDSTIIMDDQTDSCHV
jgi:hypothetical protein